MPTFEMLTAASLPPGVSVDWNGPDDPPGGFWMVEDGRTLNREAYPQLFANLGGTSSPWGLPNNATFNLPDPRNRAIVAAGGTRTLASKFGSNAVILSVANMPAHTHPVSDPGHTHPLGVVVWVPDNNPGTAPARLTTPQNGTFGANTSSQGSQTAYTGISVGSRGNGDSFDPTPLSIAKTKIIKVK